MNTDIAFTKTEQGYWDLTLDDDGDFTKLNSFDTAILLSLFGSDKRASADEQVDPALRRGWIGDQYADVPMGSKLWLLSQARLFTQTENRARDYCRDCLQWLVDYSYAYSIEVVTRRDMRLGQMIADITITVLNGTTLQRSYVLWRNTAQ